MYSPCTACGSQGHQLLDLIDGKDGNRIWVYSCPIVQQEIWTTWKRSRMFKICPIKLAYSCNLKKDRVEKVMKEYMIGGEGRHTSAEESANVHLRAVKICEEENLKEFERKDSLDWVLDLDWSDQEDGLDL